MNVLIINLILTTAEKGVITRRKSIDDTMICCLARGFVELGHHVTLLASEDFKSTEPENHSFDVVFFKSKFPRLFKPAYLPWPKRLGKYLRDNGNNFDIVISKEVFSIGTLIASRHVKGKLMIWHELALHQRMMHHLPSKIWYNLIMACFMRNELVVPVSRPAQHFIAQYAHNVSEEIVDHPADPKVLYPCEEPEDSMIVVSQLIKRKNIDKIILSFSKFVKKEPYQHYLLHIIGDGEQRQNIEQIIIDNNLSNNVVLHGFMSHRQLASLLRKAKALLFKTSKDNNVVTIPEAIVSGTPIVMNTVPTNASFVKEHGLGIVNDNWNELDLMNLVDNYQLYHQSCLLVRETLTNTGCARKFLDIFKKKRQ